MYARMDGWLFFSVVTKLLYATFTKLLTRKDHKMQPVVFLKNQADIAVLRRKTKIQCAKDFYNFCTDNLQNPKSGMYNCRIFKYIETIPRNELVNYKTVAENRKIHQIISKENSPGKLVTSSLEINANESNEFRNH